MRRVYSGNVEFFNWTEKGVIDLDVSKKGAVGKGRYPGS